MCNHRPFLSGNLRNKGRSSTRVISLYQLKERDRCLMCQPAMEELMGTAFAKASRINATHLIHRYDTSSCHNIQDSVLHGHVVTDSGKNSEMHSKSLRYEFSIKLKLKNVKTITGLEATAT